MRYTNTRQRTPKRFLIYAVVGLLCIVVLGAIAYPPIKRHYDNSRLTTIDYGPPTEAEKKAADTQKQANTQRQEIDKTPVTGAGAATVVLVDAGQYDSAIEVRSYVSNIYEDGGQCTVTLTNGNSSITRTNSAFKDAPQLPSGLYGILLLRPTR